MFKNLTGEHSLIEPSLATWLQVDQNRILESLEQLAYETLNSRSDPDINITIELPVGELLGCLARSVADTDINPSKLLDYLSERTSLFVVKNPQSLIFRYPAIQEYLAACHLSRRDFPQKIVELVRHNPHRWREVALLSGARAARNAPYAIWDLAEVLCFRGPEDTELKQVDEMGALLAGHLLVESADLSKIPEHNMLKLEHARNCLRRVIKSTYLPPGERVLAGNHLARLGDPRFDSEVCYLPTDPFLGFVEVPAGYFWMGSSREHDDMAWPDELPPHRFSLPPYYMSRYPVTAKQFEIFLCSSTYGKTFDNPEDILNHPMATITWHDAIAYCKWLHERLRTLADECHGKWIIDNAGKELLEGLANGSLEVNLPSEAQWEKVARGSAKSIYPWGDDPYPNYANYDDTGIGGTSPVGCFPTGASPYGCEEMSGNVYEWTRSLWGARREKPTFQYPYISTDGREDLAASDKIRRVVRGGSFQTDATYARCSYRLGVKPTDRHPFIGFRVAVVPVDPQGT